MSAELCAICSLIRTAIVGPQLLDKRAINSAAYSGNGGGFTRNTERNLVGRVGARVDFLGKPKCCVLREIARLHKAGKQRLRTVSRPRQKAELSAQEIAL